MTEELLEKPFCVVDFLPEQVPEGSAGRFFDVEAYYLRQTGPSSLRRRFADILLKLNCYYDLRTFSPEEEEEKAEDLSPEALVSLVLSEQQNLRVLLPGENALITLDRGDAYMTVYNPGETLLRRLERLAAAEGLFLRQPEQQMNGEDA